MPDELTNDAIRRLAKLARIELSDEELPRYRERLSAIRAYVERLRELDLQGIEPLTHVGSQETRLDEDVPGPTIPIEAIMKLAPTSRDGFIVVPKVVGDGGGA